MTTVNQYPDCPHQCFECEGADHHWMLDFDDDYPDEPVMACKHCPVRRLVGPNEDGNEPDYIPRDADPDAITGALRKMLSVDRDHMTACDRVMGDTHACTCGADAARQLLK